MRLIGRNISGLRALAKALLDCPGRDDRVAFLVGLSAVIILRRDDRANKDSSANRYRGSATLFRGHGPTASENGRQQD